MQRANRNNLKWTFVIIILSQKTAISQVVNYEADAFITNRELLFYYSQRTLYLLQRTRGQIDTIIPKIPNSYLEFRIRSIGDHLFSFTKINSNAENHCLICSLPSWGGGGFCYFAQVVAMSTRIRLSL